MSDVVGTFRPHVLVLIAAAVGLAIAKPFLLGEPPRGRFIYTAEDFVMPALPYPTAHRVGLMESRQALEHGEALFLDVRSVEEFELSHLPGAVSMPVDEVESRLDELDPERKILIYWA